MLVAMKGHPGCGKSTIARGLGRALQWPVLDKDDIRDCSQALQAALPPSNASSLLNSSSYLCLWRLAETQLQLGLSIIVDCPLSRPSLFQSASSLAQLYSKRLLVIECVAVDPQEWKRRLEARAAETAHIADALAPGTPRIAVDELGAVGREEQAVCEIGTSGIQGGADGDVGTLEKGSLTANERYSVTESTAKGWHKPGRWEDLQALVASYEGCWDYCCGSAKKLVVDTTSLCHDAAISEVLKWIQGVTNSTPAVCYLP